MRLGLGTLDAAHDLEAPHRAARAARRCALSPRSAAHQRGSINVTPDSFSDGGCIDQAEAAIAQRSLKLVEEGGGYPRHRRSRRVRVPLYAAGRKSCAGSCRSSRWLRGRTGCADLRRHAQARR